MADKVKLALAALLVVAGIAGFYVLRDSAMVLRVGAVMLGIAAAVVVAWFTTPGREFHVFAQESVAETKRVVWPTRKETIQTTGVVFMFVVVMALFLWMVDAGLLLIVKAIMGRGA